MWPFKSKPEPGVLEETKRQLESRIRTLEGEWDDTYERFRLLYARLSKRVKQLDQAPEGEAPQAVESDNVVPSADGVAGLSLSPRAQQIQNKILERRNRIQKGGTE
jgi:hypothetical protein